MPVTIQPLARSVGIGGSTRRARRRGLTTGGTSPIGNHRPGGIRALLAEFAGPAVDDPCGCPASETPHCCVVGS